MVTTIPLSVALNCPKIWELNVPGEEMLPSHKGIALVAKTPCFKQLGQLHVITTAASCKVKWKLLLIGDWTYDLVSEPQR